MAITIKGIRLESIGLDRQEKTGKLELKSAFYSLLSSTDHVLANQSIGGYNDKVVVTASFETLQMLDKFVESYKKDLSATLGLEDS